jgi:two-component sensor histidine kinase
VNTLTEILEALIRSVEKQIDGSSASLLLKDSATGSFYHVAAPNLPTGYTKTLDDACGGPFTILGISPKEGGQNVIVSDISRDPPWADYQELAAANGLRSCWSTEISAADGTTLGILAVYARKLREITDREIGVCEQFAHLAGVILERKRAEDALKGMNLKLQESLHEKESLLKEVHHRVKNNLQLISSMLSLQASRITDAAVSELFSESRNRVRSMALVHENLYRAGNFSKISMLTHIETLSASLVRAYGLNGGNIELRTEVEEILLDLDIAIPVGLIVNELTSNALKHAFPDGRRGHVHIGLRRLGPTRCELTLRDDGIGMPGSIDPRHSDSMGLQLVHDLTEQLHGSIAVTRDRGTTFTLSFDSGERAETQA